jgi:protein-tyrosine-phosphatase
MAEAVARHWLSKHAADEQIFVASAGLNAAEGAAPSRESREAMRSLGLEMDGRSKPLSEAMVRRADLVLCMTQAHARAVRDMVADSPEDLGKVHVLDRAGDVDDPIGGGLEVYRAVAQRLLKVVPQRLKEMLTPRARRRA